MKRFWTLCLVLSFCLPGFAAAELPDQLAKDFSPLSGYVIMPVGEEYLVDLDAAHGLQEGDILSLVTPGDKVIHPVTREVLGALDKVRGYLQVTRLKAGYSYAKLLNLETAPARGDQFKRFEQVPARFVADADDNELGEALRAALPQLEWRAAEQVEAPLLTFSLSGTTLTVKDGTGSMLKTYQLRPATVTPPAVPEQPPTVAATPVVSPLIVSGGPAIPQPSGAAGIVKKAQRDSGVWMGPNLAGNPVGMVVGDFDLDGRLETVVAFENHLRVSEISGGRLTEEARVEFATGTKLLSLDTIDLDGDGAGELYLSAASGTRLNSQVVEFREGGYRRTAGDVPWFFRVAELPGEGRTLLAQPVGSGENPLSESIFRVVRSGTELRRGDTLPLPREIMVFSFVPLPATDQGQSYAYLTPGDYLKVKSAAGDDLWESSEYFGGSEVSFYNRPLGEKEMVTPIYIQQRLLRTATGDIVTAQNDGGRTLQRFRNFKKSRVVALQWNGFALQESWRTPEQNGYLVDFALADADNDGQQELVVLVQYQRENLIRKGRSTLIIYELND